MQRVDAWFTGQRKRQDRIVTLEDAVLARRFGSYVVYRLRFFLLRHLLGVGVRAAKLLWFAEFFVHGELVMVTAVYVVSSTATSWWWGALEPMRDRIRDLQRWGRSHLIGDEVGYWLRRSLQPAGALLFAAVLWLGWNLWHGTITAAVLYVASAAVGMAAFLPIRCYHSGIFALRRVYRPWGVIVAMEMGAFALTLAMWPWLETWALPAASLVWTLVAGAVTLVYVRRAYGFFGLAPNLISATRRIRAAAEKESGLDPVAAGFASAAMHTEALVSIALLATAWRSRAEMLFVVFVFLGPAVRASFDWAQLFYFDLKRLQPVLLGALRDRLQRALWKVAGASGLLFWLVAMTLGSLLYDWEVRDVWMWLLVFFFAQSALGKVQVEAFTEDRYGALVTAGAVAACGYLAAVILDVATLPTLAGLAAVHLAAIVIVRRMTPRRFRTAGRPGLLEWSTAVVAQPERTAIGVLQISHWPSQIAVPQGGEGHIRQLADAVGRKLRDRDAVTVLSPYSLAWYERGAPIGDPWLTEASEGLVADVRRVAGRDGVSALRRAVASGILGYEVDSEWIGGQGADPEEVRRRFLERFPSGVVYDAMEPSAGIGVSDARGVLAAAIAFCRGVAARPGSDDVSAFSVDGQLRMIFIADRGERRHDRAAWRCYISEMNTRSAVARSAADT